MYVYKYIYMCVCVCVYVCVCVCVCVQVCNYENNVTTRLSPQWSCGSSCT